MPVWLVTKAVAISIDNFVFFLIDIFVGERATKTAAD